MHDYVEKDDFTQQKTSCKYPAWRPDKVVTQTVLDPNQPHWKSIGAEIVGKEAIPSFAEKGEDASMVEKDGVVRTPSDHMGIIADFEYQNN